MCLRGIPLYLTEANSKQAPYDLLVSKCKESGFRIMLDKPTEDGKVRLKVSRKMIEFINLTIKLSEIDIASQIIIDTFEEQEIWR